MDGCRLRVQLGEPAAQSLRLAWPHAEWAGANVARLFDPARLTQARILKGMTKRELAEAIEVSPAAIGQYEAELTAPRPELLIELSRVLGQDVGFFAGGRPFLCLDTTDDHFRSLRSMRAADRDLAPTTAEQVWELTCALERHIQLPAVNLSEILSAATPHQAAQTLQHWRFDRGPVSIWLPLLSLMASWCCSRRTLDTWTRSTPSLRSSLDARL